MKYTTITTLIIVYLISLTNIQVSAQTEGSFDPVEYAAALEMIYLVQGKNTSYPCSDLVFYCASIGQGLYTFSDLNLNSPPKSIITTDLTIFKNLTIIQINVPVEFSVDLFEILDSFKKLKTVKIQIRNQPFSNNVNLGSLDSLTINQLSVPVPLAFFNSSLTNLIMTQTPGSTLPSSLSGIVNNKLETLIMSTSCTSNLPSDISNLKVLKSLTLNFNNTLSCPFHDMSGFTSLQQLVVSFNYLGLATIFPPSITKLTNLQSLTLMGGLGFDIDQSIGFIDLSNCQKNFTLYATGFSLLASKCTKRPCLKLPLGTNLNFASHKFNMEILDYSNVTNIQITGNDLLQSIPVSTINFLKVSIFFNYNQFSGSIPNEYCQIGTGKFTIKNSASGSVASCFKCIGGSFHSYITTNMFYNSYSDFSESSQPSACPTFSFDIGSYNQIVKTDGSSVITIQGTDFGWESTPANPQENISPLLKITIPNKEVTLSIPVGEGTGHSYEEKFSTNLRFTQAFNYSYEAPVITSYSTDYDVYAKNTKIAFTGTGFSHLNQNNFTINGIDYLATKYHDDYSGCLILDIPAGEYPTDILKNGDSFTVSTKVANQISNTITFYYYTGIELKTENVKLNKTGGTITLDGVYGIVPDLSNVIVTINSEPCIVESINQNSLTIQYPSVESIGNYTITISIGGGQTIKSSIEYIETPVITESPTPTDPITESPVPTDPVTNSPTPSTTTSPSNPSSESEDDQPSNSSICSISFYFILCILLSYTLI